MAEGIRKKPAKTIDSEGLVGQTDQIRQIALKNTPNLYPGASADRPAALAGLGVDPKELRLAVESSEIGRSAETKHIKAEFDAEVSCILLS